MRKLLELLSCVLFIVSCQDMAKKKETSTVVKPPTANKIPKELKLHGDVRQDPYFWMRERDSKPVLDYVKAENDYAESILKKAEPIAKDLFKEMKARIKEDDVSAPSKKDDYYYYVRTEKSKEYPIFCRKKGSLSAKEEIILDINVLAAGKKYYSASVVDISPNHEMLAFAADEVGRRFYTIHFKNLKTGQILSETIPKTTGNFIFAADNKTGFFVKQNPETLRSEKVFRYALGDKEPVEIYYEKDEIFDVGVGGSMTDKYIFIGIGSTNTSEYRYIPADKPFDKFKLFAKREKNHEYSVDDGGDGFYIRTNSRAKNFRLAKAPYTNTAKSAWTAVAPHRKEFYIEQFKVFKDFYVLEGREKGLNILEVYNKKTGKKETIKFPDPVYVAGIDDNDEFETQTLRYSYNSLVQPGTIYDYDVKTKKSVVVKQDEVPTYDASLYTAERSWAKATDGTLVPISLVYKKDLFKKGENPLFMYGYGSYGLSMDAGFRYTIISLLDRGFVYAIAHIRGGQELGRDWYEKGRMMHKKNTFTDFIAATEHMLKKGYGKPGHVYMQGGSAGGLLMGAVLNLRPDLYHGAHAAVPFVDVVTTMLDSTIPLTTAEYEQWGNPNEKPAYKYIKTYSPYDNVTKQKYPNILITTGYHDSQVQYWEPLKWAARLREYNQSDNLILMKTEMGAGHSGVTGRFARTKEVADDYSFIVWLEENNKG